MNKTMLAVFLASAISMVLPTTGQAGCGDETTADISPVVDSSSLQVALDEGKATPASGNNE